MDAPDHEQRWTRTRTSNGRYGRSSPETPSVGPDKMVTVTENNVLSMQRAACRAWTEEGFAFLSVNYRSSSGRGRVFEEQIHGDVGHWELEDLAAAHRWPWTSGVSTPGQVIISGEPYGGFLVLYALGRQPGLWAAGIAEVAMADRETGYRDSSPALRRFSATCCSAAPLTPAAPCTANFRRSPTRRTSGHASPPAGFVGDPRRGTRGPRCV